MSILNMLQEQANAEAEYGQDMSVATVSTSKLYPAGYAMCRLVEYVEMGNHAQEYKGTVKAAQPIAQLGFAVWGEGIQNDDGTPAIMRPWPLTLYANDKAKAFKLFKKLNYKGTAKRFSQLLNESYLIKIIHTVPKAAGDAVKAVVDLEGFLPPYDSLTKAPYPVPQAPDSVFKLMLWNAPTKMMWDSLFVDGKWDDGSSKNRVQETCLSAVDFAGSALEQMLVANGIAFVIPPKPVAAPTAVPLPTAPTVAVPGIPSLVAPSELPVQAPVPAPVAAVVAAVAAINPPFDGGVIPEMPTIPVMPVAVVMPVAAPVAMPALAVPNLPVIPQLPV
jgi:hypothetical protein